MRFGGGGRESPQFGQQDVVVVLVLVLVAVMVLDMGIGGNVTVIVAMSAGGLCGIWPGKKVRFVGDVAGGVCSEVRQI